MAKYLTSQVGKPKVRALSSAPPNETFQVKQGAKEDKEESKKHKLLAPAVAGALPMVGAIGEQPIIHDPLAGAKGQSFRNYEELSRAARPGDVMVLSKPKGSFFKNIITPAGGSEFYHAQPVYGRRGGHGITADTGWLEGNTEKELRRRSRTVMRDLPDQGYGDAVLLRPKKPLTSSQSRIYNRESMQRSAESYSIPKAVESYAKELFMPKLGPLTGGGKQVGEICEGNICSTVPSQAFHSATGRNVVPGKRAQDVFPSDFLRSKEYELVGSKLDPNKARMNPALRKAMPYITRGGVGLGLAGATYESKEHPELAGAVAGATGAGLAGTAMSHALSKTPEKAVEALPGLTELGSTVMHEIPKKQVKQIYQRYLTRRVPLMAAGGAAGYMGVKKLREALHGGEGEKQAFATSEYSGPLGPAGPLPTDYIPPFKRPNLNKVAGPPSPEDKAKLAGLLDELTKLNGVPTTPAGRLAKAKTVGAPKVTAPPGPSIAEIAKPVGYGLPQPGATKTASVARNVDEDTGDVRYELHDEVGRKVAQAVVRHGALEQLYVEPEHRGQGLARSLVKAAKADHDVLQIKPRPFNDMPMSIDQLSSFYSSEGFNTVDGSGNMFFSKSAEVKTALLEELVRVGLKDIPGTPRLLMKERGIAERAAIGKGVAGAYDKTFSQPVRSVADKHLLSKLTGKKQDFARKAVNLFADDPVGTTLANAIPIPGADPAYRALKAGGTKLLNRLDPVPA